MPCLCKADKNGSEISSHIFKMAMSDFQQRKMFLCIILTSQKLRPRKLLPNLSNGGDHSMKPITFGTTTMIPPATPDFAGIPTYGNKEIVIQM